MDRIRTNRYGDLLIRDLNIRAYDVLGWLGDGESEQQIMAKHPNLERQDFMAVYSFVALIGNCAAAAERFKEIGADFQAKISALQGK